MANKLLQQLREQRDYGKRQGVILGCDLCALALNHVFGFGDDRLHRLETEVQKYLDEISEAKDIQIVEARIAKELSEIRHDTMFLKRYIEGEK